RICCRRSIFLWRNLAEPWSREIPPRRIAVACSTQSITFINPTRLFWARSARSRLSRRHCQSPKELQYTFAPERLAGRPLTNQPRSKIGLSRGDALPSPHGDQHHRTSAQCRVDSSGGITLWRLGHKQSLRYRPRARGGWLRSVAASSGGLCGDRA